MCAGSTGVCCWPCPSRCRMSRVWPPTRRLSWMTTSVEVPFSTARCRTTSPRSSSLSSPRRASSKDTQQGWRLRMGRSVVLTWYSFLSGTWPAEWRVASGRWRGTGTRPDCCRSRDAGTSGSSRWGCTPSVVLCCVVLCCVVLCCVVLYCAVLCSAVLCCVVLCCAVLCCAVMSVLYDPSCRSNCHGAP